MCKALKGSLSGLSIALSLKDGRESETVGEASYQPELDNSRTPIVSEHRADEGCENHSYHRSLKVRPRTGKVERGTLKSRKETQRMTPSSFDCASFVQLLESG